MLASALAFFDQRHGMDEIRVEMIACNMKFSIARMVCTP